MYVFTDTIVQDGNLRVVKSVSDFPDPAPDYCGADILLSWERFSGWWISVQSCDGDLHATCSGHPIDSERVLEAAEALARPLDLDTFQRWLNAFSPEGITYYVSPARGYSQGDYVVLIEALPSDVDYSPDPSNHEFVAWAFGDVYDVYAEEYDAESDTWHRMDDTEVCLAYGDASADEQAPELLDDARHALARRAEREADLTALYI